MAKGGNKGRPTRSKPAPCDTQQHSSKKKERFGFTIVKDLSLLRLALCNNPWQLGDHQWDNVAEGMKVAYGTELTVRTCKDRIDLLMQKFTKEELNTKTGTEQERTERVDLLRQIIELKAEADASLHIEKGANDESVAFEESSSADELSEDSGQDVAGSSASVLESEVAPTSSTQNAGKRALLAAERKAADEERSSAFEKYKKDLSDEPSGVRAKRRKTKEEEIIITKMEHDMEIERRRLELEKQQHDDRFLLETSRIELEKAKLQAEQAQEERRREEAKRQSDLAAALLNMQTNMCDLVKVLAEAVKKN